MTRVERDFSALLIFGICLTCCLGFGERDVRYRGPDEVWEGDPFSISCILTARDAEGWTLDNTPIADDNALGYALAEKPLDPFRKEVTLRVQSAQLHHQGKYRCNRFSRDYHHLEVRPAFPDAGKDQEATVRKPSYEYILEINKTVEFYCSSAKDDDVPVMWFKNGAQIKESSRSNIVIAGLSLIIENAQEDDIGEYMCTVDTSKVTGYTYIGRLFYLNSPPRIVDFPSKKSIIRGQDLKLSCKVKGYPTPKFTWFIGNLNATKLKETDPRIFIHPDDIRKSVLVIERASSQDRGLYTCRAENSVDSGQTVDYDEESVFVHVRENAIETNEDQPGMGKVLIPGDTLQLQCNTTECPHCVVIWYKDGEKMYPIADHIEIHEENNSITIENSSYEDSGVYVCVVDFQPLESNLDIPTHLQCKQEIREENGWTRIIDGFDGPVENDDDRNHFKCQAFNQVDADHTTMSIQVKTVYSINQTSTTTFIQKGGGFELACQVAGLGVHLWYKDGKPIVPNSVNKFHLESNNPSFVAEMSDYYTTMRLIVKEADSVHTGEYKCNNAGLYSQRIVVVTDGMIKTNEDLPGVGKTFNPGEPLLLECNTTDCNLCTVIWFKNGQKLHSVPGHLRIHDKNNSIVIEKASYNDSGVYVCAIDRKHLDVALNASIVVQSKIKLEKFDASDVVTEGSPLELFCNAKGAPTPLIKWFIEDKEIFEDDERIKLLEHDGLKKGKLLIEEADFDDRNHYTCEAYNQVDAVNSTVFIRVKGKLAALWPFLGICAEVVILGTIIFVYERRKSMNQCDEPDTALPSENKHRDQKGKGQDVRQRK